MKDDNTKLVIGLGFATVLCLMSALVYISLSQPKTINDIAHVLGKQTIAESVENDGTLRPMAELGIDYAQGYAIRKPRPLEALAQQNAVA